MGLFDSCADIGVICFDLALFEGGTSGLPFDNAYVDDKRHAKL